MGKTVDFYFDFSSSYSYVAVHKLLKLAAEHGLEVNWKPVALGAIFKNLGHAPPVGDTVKGAYVRRDVERSAAEIGLAYHWPDPFPWNSMTAARIFWYLMKTDEQQAVDWMLAVFDASFGKGKDCSDAAVLEGIAAELNLNASELLAAAKDDEVKQALFQVTGEAADRGVFGAPIYFLDGEMYWGADRMEQLERQVVEQG